MRIEDIDPFLCTHIIYAFATISVHQATLVGAEWDDEGTPNNSKVYTSRKINQPLGIYTYNFYMPMQ